MGFEALGRWILLDVQNVEHPLLLMVGCEMVAGLSARRNLDQVGVHVLLPAVAEAVQSGHDSEHSVRHGVRTLHVRVVLTRAPLTSEVVAVRAIVTSRGGHIPAIPLVGPWEWDITQPTTPGDRLQTMTHWGPEMYQLYGHIGADADAAVGHMPTPEWYNTLIAEPDRIHLFGYITQALTTVGPDLYILGYRIATTTGLKPLRLIGRGHVDDTGRTRWFRGISHEANGEVRELTPGLQPPDIDALHRAVIELLDDTAIAVISTADGRVYDRSTPAAWAALGIYLPADGNPATVVHPDDQEIARAYIRDIASHSRRDPIHIRLADPAGKWKLVRLAARVMPALNGVAPQVVCRVSL